MKLAEAPDIPDPGEAFTEAVLGGVKKIRRREKRMQAVRQILPIVLLAVYLTHSLTRPAPADARLASVQSGQRWLEGAQEADGSWSAERWGGHRRFTPGVTALATLALLENAPEASPSATRAGEWILGQLSPQTLRMQEGPVLYNHLLSLHALVALERLEPDPVRLLRIRQALQDVLRMQQEDGGWGYAEEIPLAYGASRRARSNSAVTWWVWELLRQSEGLLPDGGTRALARADAWLETCFAAEGAVRYHPLSPGVSPESALYWMAAVWREEDVSSTPRPEREDFYRDVFVRQARSGPSTEKIRTQTADGSWSAEQDRWGRAGGSVYTTAAALLTLKQ